MPALPGTLACRIHASCLTIPFVPLALTSCFIHSPQMITMIVGTNRPGSNTRSVARQVEEIYHKLGASLEVLDLAQLPAEIFSAASYASKPASFLPFSEAILRSSGLVIVTPEYNGGMPGILKYF